MTAKTNQLRRNVGRLLEIRAYEYRTVADVEAMIAMIRGEVTKLPSHERAVIMADWRTVHVFAPDVSDAVLAMLNTFNPRIERSAIVIADSAPTTLLQVSRLVRESASPVRRLCRNAEEAQQWLDPVLDDRERASLHAFLAELDAAL